jgi:hypothetical protein
MRLLILILLFLSTPFSLAQTKRIGIYVQDPIQDTECAESLKFVLEKEYEVQFIKHNTLTEKTLANIDLIAFGGGLGDSDQFDTMLIDRKKVVKNYIDKGGRYLGICMGAYFAGHHYFDILKDADTVRYVDLPDSTIYREDETIAKIKWGGRIRNMYFFDGCAIIGKNFKTFATYSNGSAMAAIQGKIGLIGCHPESLKDWYVTEEMKKYWHEGTHHELLLSFVHELLRW